MTLQQSIASGPLIVAYDRARVHAILRDWSTIELHERLRAGQLGTALSADEAAELEALLTAWSQRALGQLPLRDGLLVDSARGRQVYNLLCRALTRDSASLHPSIIDWLGRDLPADLSSEQAVALTGELQEARRVAATATLAGLTLAIMSGPGDYPAPDNLDSLVLPAPAPPQAAPPRFEQPTGWRWWMAVGLAIFGVALLILPILSSGKVPEQPAGLPLALITLALMIGIRAGPAGFSGALCIWLIANLPGFRHGNALFALWPGLPILAVGVFLLSRDQYVRALWHWLRRRVARKK